MANAIFFSWVIFTIVKYTDYGRPVKLFSLKSIIFGLGQTNWADKFGAFSAEYQQYFWYSESLYMFFIILQKTKPLYPHPNIYLGLGFEFGLYRISVLAYVCPQSVVQYYIEKPCYMSSLLYLINIHFYSNPLPNLAGFDFRLQQLYIVSFDKKIILKMMRPFGVNISIFQW